MPITPVHQTNLKIWLTLPRIVNQTKNTEILETSYPPGHEFVVHNYLTYLFSVNSMSRREMNVSKHNESTKIYYSKAV